MRVARWGNSLAIRLPKQVVEALDLKEGDEINLRPLEKGAIGVAERPSVEDHLTALRKLRGTLPDNFAFDRDEANER